jgi:hypothetical protein
VSLISIFYHAYALGLLPITTKYGKIIHHQTFIYHRTISNIFFVFLPNGTIFVSLDMQIGGLKCFLSIKNNTENT